MNHWISLSIANQVKILFINEKFKRLSRPQLTQPQRIPIILISDYLSVCLSVRPSVRPTIHPTIHPSILLSIQLRSLYDSRGPGIPFNQSRSLEYSSQLSLPLHSHEMTTENLLFTDLSWASSELQDSRRVTRTNAPCSLDE